MGHTYYLQSMTFDDKGDAHQVRIDAQRIADAMTRVGAIQWGTALPLSVDAVVEYDTRGRQGRTTMFAGGIASGIGGGRGNAVVTDARGDVVDPEEIESRDEVNAWVQLHLRNDDVAHVLDLFDAACDFPTLYLVLEAIEAQVGGEAELLKKQWAAKSDIKLFKRFINYGYRHDNRGHAAPARSMPYSEAAALIRALIIAWIRET